MPLSAPAPRSLDLMYGTVYPLRALGYGFGLLVVGSVFINACEK